VRRGCVAVPAPTRPRVSPPRPRRVSGPARRAAPATPPAAPLERGLAVGVLARIGGLSHSGALDRLIRGRIWIGVIAFALIGIVTLQLLVLQLNASIGRSLVRQAQLQRENATLSIEDSELASGERVEAKAAHLGMRLVPIDSLRFLNSDPGGDIARAAAALNAPVHKNGSSSDETGASATSEPATAGAAASASDATAGTGAETTGATTESTPAATGATGESSPGAGGQTPTATGQSGQSAETGEASAPTGTDGAAQSSAPVTSPASPAAASAPAGPAGGTEPPGAG
jgi:cell division protein FtsL